MADAKPSNVIFPGVRVEIDVTPRWFHPGPSFFEDAADIARAIGSWEGATRSLFVDLSVGLTGVRVVLGVPGSNITDALEHERAHLKAHLDALDGVSPRRRRITVQREEEAAKKVAAEAAAKAKQEEQPPPPVTDPAAQDAPTKPE